MRPDRAVRTAAAALIEWERAFEKALLSGDPLTASDILRRTGRRGWVKKAEYSRAAAIVRAQSASSFVRRDWATRLLQHPRRVDKELAAVILRPLIATNRPDVERAVHRLARDDDWEVRETAASLLGDCLERAFDAYLRTAQGWIATGEPRLRRAVVVGAKYAARSRHPERAEPLLDLIEPALKEPDEYVRRNLGPFAIGDQLLRSYPDATFARLERWARDPDENVRWNVASTFTSASGAKVAERGFGVLAFLAADTRPFVTRAVSAAVRNILKRRPELRDAIAEWDGGTRAAVRRALEAAGEARA
ncbi:MAG TPA: DNA alkylation repair protein [Candidatus Limnocylindria bacterium]|nr:DNA alkylation repair protein [Candidatus Limnocylindria bacterium]